MKDIRPQDVSSPWKQAENHENGTLMYSYVEMSKKCRCHEGIHHRNRWLDLISTRKAAMAPSNFHHEMFKDVIDFQMQVLDLFTHLNWKRPVEASRPTDRDHTGNHRYSTAR